MSVSVFFILSKRGDTIIYRDFRREIHKGINEVFFRKVNLYDNNNDEPTSPIFNVNGVNFIYLQKTNLYIVIATLDNGSPFYFLEILVKLTNVIKDLCGILNEESIRKNFVMVYEIIDEFLDFGFPQLSSTEEIKPFVYTEPVILKNTSNIVSSIINKSTKSGVSTQKPMGQKIDAKNKKNEIFVDIIEKITALFSPSGKLINFGIDGYIKMKSYLHNNPELKLVLNDDITIGDSNNSRYSSGYSGTLDDCNFHPKVNTRDFYQLKTLFITPPDGEFVVMNYRMNAEFAPPFKFYTIVEESNYKLELKIKVQSNFIDRYFAGNVLIKFNVPKSAQSVYFELEKQKIGQKADYIIGEKMCIWSIPKFQGGSENVLVTKITIQNNNPSECRNEIGPITINFEIPNYNISKLNIKELKVLVNDKNYNALRWIRTISQANSYVIRVA